MRHVFGLIVLGAVLAMPAHARAGGALASGNWQVGLLDANATAEQVLWIVKVETKDDVTSGSHAGAAPFLKSSELTSFTVKDGQVRATFKFQGNEFQFNGRAPNKDGKHVLGVFSGEGFAQAARMTPTELTALKDKDIVQKLGVAEMDQAATLTRQALMLRARARFQKDAEERKKLLQEAEEAEKNAAAEAPKLYREVLEKHAGSYASGRAALLLLEQSKHAATEAELQNWLDVALKSAQEYGSAWESETAMQAAAALIARKGQGALAVEAARRAERLLTGRSSTDQQVKVLDTLLRAMKTSDKNAADVAVLAKRIAALETVLDREYQAKVPPFDPDPFAGRKSSSDRAVVMELFTGAQCPPCVAADVAFDALQKAYKPRELVLLQYHLHIPGPDPLTNADSVARSEYYKVGSTPTSLFNGSPKAEGGGGMANAKNKFQEYCGVIDPLLEMPAKCKVTASAKRKGDTIVIDTEVSGLKDPGSDVKLRLALVEESIRYVGGNKLRFHHQVVRAMPGGPDGVAIPDKTFKNRTEFDLAKLRKTLTSYLDDYAKNEQAFPRPDRPMDLHGLRLIAFVQDDATREILQAVQVDVTE
jgi:hypothetical protein